MRLSQGLYIRMPPPRPVIYSYLCLETIPAELAFLIMHPLKTKLNSVAFSPQTNYTDRETAACADRGCLVVSATDPPGR
jgi:hypothetical protein